MNAVNMDVDIPVMDPMASPRTSTCLHRAAQENDTESAIVYMSLFLDPNARNELGNTPLHCAQSAEMVHALIDGGGTHINATNDRGRTPLIEACLHDRVTVAEALTNAGADATAADHIGNTALHVAEGTEMVSILVSSGGSVHAETKNGWTPMHFSCYKDINTTRALLDNGADINATDRYNQTPLHFIVEMADHTKTDFVLKNGARVNHRDYLGNSPLHNAAEKGNDVVILTLLAAGANPYLVNCDRVSALEIAHVRGHNDLVHKMIQGSPYFDVDTAHFRGNTQLHRTALHGYDAMAAILLDLGADPNRCNTQGKSPLDFAFQSFNTGVAKLLILGGADVERADIYGRKPLHLAAERGYHDVMEALLDKGADFSSRTNNGYSPLGCAYEGGHGHIVKLLISRGVDVDSPDSSGATLLYHEATKGCVAMTEFLLLRGANPSMRDDDGYSPLDMAVSHEREDVIRTLIRYGTDVTEADSRGFTALHLAESENIVHLLIDAGADPNAANQDLNTPLMEAVHNVATTRALLRRGARPNIQNNMGRTALHMAPRCKPKHVFRIVDLLLRAGADETAADKHGYLPKHYFKDKKPSGMRKARRLLRSAPRDRRWRRRGLLLLCMKRGANASSLPPLTTWITGLRGGQEGIFRTIVKFL